MVLNWTIEVIINITVGLIGIFCTILTYKVPKAKNIISLTYIRFGMIFIAFFILFEGFSDLLLNFFLKRISLCLYFPAAIFWLAVGDWAQ